MKNQLEQRLEQLRAELANGERVLMQLDQQRVRTTMTIERIRGAIQVLEELLAVDEQPPPDELPPDGE